ncbi:MAG: anaerobic ribonucleoside-triphosphate reductase activating protein [Rickettsiales bacterium]|jgi:pyruvate formate lyase activating enzyme|nr:anaerobic ribonucleoside-triphosphate reductase activating protein [Rickettsiales bacterium]
MPSAFPIIGGFVPFTTIDYPGAISIVLFLQGCTWRCVYCSNPHLFELRARAPKDAENWAYVLDLLRRRAKTVDAVVFSGGEATLQSEEIAAAVSEIRGIAPYKIGLHTNGCSPDGLRRLLPLVDWIGLDVKGPADRYDLITKVGGSAAPAFESLDMVIGSGVPFEVRTTCDPRVLSKGDILRLADVLSERGVGTYALQKFRPPAAMKDQVPMRDIIQFFTDRDFEGALKAKFRNLILRW